MSKRLRPMKWRWIKRVLRKRSERKFNPESGQGALEYILLVLITMVIILGLVYEFNYKFKNFLDNYFGNYIACLLETGELPGTTGGTCASEYQTISDQTGKQLLKFGNGGASSSSTSSSKTSSSSSNTPRATGEAISSNSGQTSNFNNSGGSSSGGKALRSNVNGAAGKKDANAMGYQTLYGAGGAYDKNASTGGNSGDKKYYMTVGDDADASNGKASVSKTDKKSNNNNALKPKRVTQDAFRKIANTGDVQETPFTFGDFIRWIIIGALILIIIIFFGGQLMQIMRSREKGGGD